MKNLFNYFLILGFLLLSNISFSQDDVLEDPDTQETSMQDDSSPIIVDSATEIMHTVQFVEEDEIEEVVEESQSFHYAIKEQFIQGGWQFMGIVLLCLILGLAVAIERIITSSALPDSFIRRASSTAFSSGGFIDIFTLSFSTPLPSGLTLICTL